ncbi:unnamed protein product [Didymodactylos carnosus]|uniref:Serine protease n=1 Tax=Didymodactylos carnosus TaxID=1234261 RepID=A0A814FGZ3_9BILA|nr:unnamed protein product [Didymodactylos carnosus]CAF3755667.1 unnamed protein product [Didymodactylos carnosus]
MPSTYNISNKPSSEEEYEVQQRLKHNRAVRSKHKTSYERPFMDYQTNKLKENIPFTYSPNGRAELTIDSDMHIDLRTLEQLEHLSKLVIKIRVEFQQDDITSYVSGSGLIVNGRYIITAAHVFNPLTEEDNVLVPYKRIIFTSLSYASDRLFNTDNENVLEAEILIRGIGGIGLQPSEICSEDDDIAILGICRFEQVKHTLVSENKEEFCAPRLSEKDELEPNSQLFLLSYCSTMRRNKDVKFYEECPGYSSYTRENVNSAMHPDHRTVSIGKYVKNEDMYIVHDCPSLRGASGGAIFDTTGRFVGVHTGVRDGDVHYNISGEKRLLPYAMNRALAVYSNRVKRHLEDTIPAWK